ncbi:MAG: class I tRNA ligase family protein [Planctomycetota bacterium]
MAEPTPTESHAPPPHAYRPAEVESRWRAHWEQAETFRVDNPGEDGFDPSKPKFYVLDMFPYPSGVGLHVGHPLGYIATDIVGRYKRMRGFHVLHPMGFDAFGLPAEQFAVEHNVHPRVTTEQNIANMVEQLRRLGLGYDWSRQVATTDPGYYRWTQWVFLQLYESYFDPVQNKALPIEQLRLKLEGEDYYVGLDGELIWSGNTEDLESIAGIGNPTVRKWHELDPDQQRRLLDEYRLAFRADAQVNWCPALGTVLANEEVTADQRSERGNHPVFKRPLTQWMLRITSYADRLSDDLERVDWPASIKKLQRDWIGRSQGAEVDFPVAAEAVSGKVAPQIDTDGESIRVFTTRPDTLFGATFMVLAPEHPMVRALTTPAQRSAVEAYVAQAAAKTEQDRRVDAGEKTGVFTGGFAVNPATGQPIPVYAADYVLMGYGTGAIMAVPAHDQRDHGFATKHGIDIVEVIRGDREHDVQHKAFVGDGVAVHSANDEVSLDGLRVTEAKAKMIDWLESGGFGRGRVQYKLRDWLFSRQRYWGEPFPILHELDDAGEPTGVVRAVDAADLPVEHPHMDDFKPTSGGAADDPEAPPQPPLGRASDDWRFVELDGKRYARETNTMPQWAGSCWYYLRFLDPTNDWALVDPAVERYWMGPSEASERAASVSERGPRETPSSSTASPGGVDLYVGGVEHAVLHLLYARFWHKVLYDLGHVSTPEPFGRLFNQGYIQAYYYEDERGVRVPAADVVTAEGKPAYEHQGEAGASFLYEGKPVAERYGKMGKSLKNAVSPDEVCAEYGADSLRLYEMYLGPLDQSKPWSTKDIVGVHRFLQRLWRRVVDVETGDLRIAEEAPSEDLLRALHKTIHRVTDAMEPMAFNVAIAALIEFNNTLTPLDAAPRICVEDLVRMLAPMAPHVCEELWRRLGHETSVADADWPAYDPALLIDDTIELPVQVNGKLRGKVTVPADADRQAVEDAARAEPNVAVHLEGKTIRKVVVVPGKLVNLVVG